MNGSVRLKSLRVMFPVAAMALLAFGCEARDDGNLSAREPVATVVSIRASDEGSSVVSPDAPGISAVSDHAGQTEVSVQPATVLVAAPSPVAAAPTVETLEAPRTLEQRLSYTYGYLVMASAMRTIPSIDASYFARGAMDYASGVKPYIPKEAMNDVLFEYQDKLISEASRQLEELSRMNLENAEGFLAVNGAREGVQTTASGLQYEVVKRSDGVYPKETDTVKVNYTLTYLDGRVGDSSAKGVPSIFNLANMVPGFREGLMLMTTGSSYRFFVHPRLGYGEAGSNLIEPNTLLIFDVELVEIVGK